MQTFDTNKDFEQLAREFLKSRADIPHQWKSISNSWGGRADLVCWPDTQQEVFASLSDGQITVGNRVVDKDFEDFGRGLSKLQLATEAFDYFQELISEQCSRLQDAKL